MSTSQLTLYNGALRLLGQAKLSALTDAIENRYTLDDAYNENAINYCLEQGLWNFAVRTSKGSADSSVTPDFGFQYAFAKPSDWIRTITIASDEFFTSPLTELDYVDEQGFWFSNLETIYIRYVSNDSEYGADLSLWPQTFVRMFETYLAMQIAPRLFQDEGKIDALNKLFQRRLVDARSKDALNEGAKFRPAGSWVTARRGYSGFGRADRGSRSRLTG